MAVARKRTKFQVRSDAAKQRWVRDEKKEAFWRKHRDGWRSSGLSKRAYCVANDLSQSSFTAWMRELELRDREKISSANAMELLTEEQESEPKNPFVPLRLLADNHADQALDQTVAEDSSQDRRIDILVPGGAIIRLNENCSTSFVAELFHSLKG